MEYIQCTHCGKRYAVSPKVREAEGKFTTCKSCNKKFLIAIHGDKKKPEKSQEEPIVLSDGWDPSLTMPEEPPQLSREEGSVEDELADDTHDAAEVLATLQAQRKKKRLIYAGLGLLGVLLVAGAWFWLSMPDTQQTAPLQATQAKPKIQPSPKEQDMRNDDCRHAAALQWLLDTRAMHGTYDAQGFVRLVKASEKQSEQVRKLCKTPTILQDLISAATKQEKPAWIADDIAIVEANRH